MKLIDLPKEIAESDNVGEMFVWNFLTIIIDEIPESDNKTEIQKSIKNRQNYLIESEV